MQLDESVQTGACVFIRVSWLTMFDTDKFIQCVQNHPPIWEKASKEYSDRNLREKSWHAVGEMMFEMWSEMTEKARQEQVIEMKNKWRHIRDSFSKFISHGKSGDPASKKKKYVYADALSFLLQTIEKRRTSGNVSNKAQDDDATQSSHEEDEANQRGDDAVDSVNTTRPTSSSTPVSFKKPTTRKLQGMTAFQQELLQHLHSQNKEEEDSDKSFLLSLLPEMKKLNDNDKLDFQLYTLQFFRDIRRKRMVQPPAPLNHLHNYVLQYSNFPTHSRYQTNNSSLQHNPSFVSSPFPSPGSSTETPEPIRSPQESVTSEDTFSAYSSNIYENI